jgi:chemotaxis protein MotB
MRRLIAAFALTLGLAGCGVPQERYDAAVKSAADAKADAKADADRKDARIAELERENQTLHSDLDVARGQATSEEDRKRLEELQRQQEEAAARARLLTDLVDKFKAMVDAGTLKIIERHGRLVLQLQNDVLFDPFKTDIKPAGKTALVQIAATLRTIHGRRFQVAGHTDVVVVHTKEFPSNWELSCGRAISVVKLLVEQGVDPHELSAAGYSLYDPVGRDPAHNRRIEITLVPNVEGILREEQQAGQPPAH